MSIVKTCSSWKEMVQYLLILWKWHQILGIYSQILTRISSQAGVVLDFMMLILDEESLFWLLPLLTLLLHIVLVENWLSGGIEAWILRNNEEMVELENDEDFLAYASPNPSVYVPLLCSCWKIPGRKRLILYFVHVKKILGRERLLLYWAYMTQILYFWCITQYICTISLKQILINKVVKFPIICAWWIILKIYFYF